jgi:hypothetical protein
MIESLFHRPSHKIVFSRISLDLGPAIKVLDGSNELGLCTRYSDLCLWREGVK